MLLINIVKSDVIVNSDVNKLFTHFL